VLDFEPSEATDDVVAGHIEKIEESKVRGGVPPGEGRSNKTDKHGP